LEKGLGKEILGNMHMHTAGIEYGSKGERNHTNLKDSDLDYRALMQAFKDFGVKGTLVCESPNLEEDALLMKRTYGRL
jgi:deoxyribonuclease-4